MTRQTELVQKTSKSAKRSLREVCVIVLKVIRTTLCVKVKSDEEEETVIENIEFIINEDRSTSSSKFVVRRRTVVHKTEKEQDDWSEVFEETFTIPLHKFNLGLILSQTKIEKVEETVVLRRTVFRKKVQGESAEEEEIQLTLGSGDDHLPMIDFTEICNIKIVESRQQIVQQKVSFCCYQTWL